MNKLHDIPKEERNCYDHIIVHLCEMHKKWWMFKLSSSYIKNFGEILQGMYTEMEEHAFFVPQLKIELNQKIKTKHISWFAQGLNWILSSNYIIDNKSLLPCECSKGFGKVIRLFTRNN